MMFSFVNRCLVRNSITSMMLPNTISVLRYAGTNPTVTQTDGEAKLNDILKLRFPSARLIDVKDVSAGCGASYEIIVVADEFANMRIVNQHRLVSEALGKQLPNIHAIRIFTGTDEKQFLSS